MTGRLGIDFGTSNTVISLWDVTTNDSSTFKLGNFSRLAKVDGKNLYSIPSIIHYSPEFKYLYGNEVNQQNLLSSPRTFKWMKRYIAERSPVERTIDDRKITYHDAGRRFLTEILQEAGKFVSPEEEDVVLTVPVEAYEDYTHWLSKVVNDASLFRFKIIDEPSAAALGYEAELNPDDIYLVFDFGGGTLDVAIVKMEGDLKDAGKFCHVLGKAGLDLGGTRIDEWLFQEIFERQGKELSEDDWNIVSRSLLTECETLKERLSFEEIAEVSVFNPFTGGILAASFTRTDFETLLDKHDAFSKIDKTIRRALKIAEQKGFTEEDIKSVLMVGGCSNIPAIQKMLKRIFGNEKVKLTRPMDAVARGAARYAAGMAFKDYIQHDYAIRYVNPINGLYEYRPIVRRGTQYPTSEPTAILTIKASFDGQNQLGIPIFEIGHDSWSAADMKNEIFFDYAGKPHEKKLSETETAKRNFFWINKKNPTFLWADPPAKKSEPYFELQFLIDSNRKLLITARNVKTGKTMLEAYPVANLI